jgi:hypothetical protein
MDDVTHVAEIDAPIGIEVITEHEHALRADAPDLPR